MHLYREFPPHPALAGHVVCLWTSHAAPGGAPVRHRVLPDNCIDILWQDRAPLGFVAGMMSRAHRVEFVQPVLTVAVRFLPGAARAFFDLPLHGLQDEHASLDMLWTPHEAEALAAALWEREQTVTQRLATLERALLERLRRGLESAHHRADHRAGHLARTAVGLIERSGGAVRIEELARSLGVSRQHLALQFREQVGLNAKTFAMVCRFRRASAALRSAAAGACPDGIDWAALAGECGYYDQSHLIHAFQQFAGETPEAFARP
jgi:AraC-like DNA-binding protein